MPWMVSVGTSDCAEAAKDSKYNETDNINFFIIRKHSVVTKITLLSITLQMLSQFLGINKSCYPLCCISSLYSFSKILLSLSSSAKIARNSSN